jgi:N-acetylglucosaminyldiphosphoundecaprenol N-acetyl-beta-D-mannosaminyltransferase
MRRQIRLGKIYADDISFSNAIARIVELAQTDGGLIVTPNVDHVVIAESSSEFREVYNQAELSLVDGQPLVWMAKLLGEPFPEKISGSDLVRPLCGAARDKGLSVYILGATDESSELAARNLEAEFPGLKIAGRSSPIVPSSGEGPAVDAAMVHLRECKPNIVLVALGSPKQELLMLRQKQAYAPAVALGIGATIDFIAGKVQRCPPWISRIGFEWLYRLLQEPKRLAHRYLVRDTQIIPIFLRMLRMPRSQRTFTSSSLRRSMSISTSK